MNALRPFVERHLRAFNTRDFDAWSELFDEGIEVSVDSTSMRGLPAARAYAAGVVRAYPGVLARLERVVAEADDTIVVEYRLVNPAADQSQDAWRLDGLVCEILEMRGGRIVACRSYYSPTATDRTDVVNVPSRAEAGRIAEEQAALRRVAELVARGVAPEQVFEAVAIEASRLLGNDSTALLRYHVDGAAVVVAVGGGAAGVGVRLPTEGENGVRAAVGAPIVAAGRLWGRIVAVTSGESSPAGTEDRLAEFAELVAAAIGNADSRAEIIASRARVVAIADEARGRVQRDLHDGAQQRLVQTVILLKLARAALRDAGGPPAAELVDEALLHAEWAIADLRELVHGNMPEALSGGGLRAGVHALVRRMSVPVIVDVLSERLPCAVETTAYFVVAEALTNAVKHARAAGVGVTAVLDGDVLRLEVHDNGIGGADLTRGTGFVGLADRVALCGGTISITSPPGVGTTVVVTLPVQPSGATPASARTSSTRRRG